MNRCILAPVDGSAFGEHALPLAAALAKRTDSVLRVAHVHVPLIAPSGVETMAFRGAWSDVTKEQERGYLRELVARLAETHGVEAVPMLVDGPVATALESCALETGASLVVMSTHAHARFRRLWHHGVADQIARDLPVPVLLVHPQHEEEEPDFEDAPDLRHILVPLDGTEYAEGMIEHASALGRPLGARFTLLRVIRPEVAIGYTLLSQDGHVNHHRLEAERVTALRYLERVAERMRAHGVEVATAVVASADPASAIAAYAQKSVDPVDLIALETHPHRPVARIVAPHTADLLLRDSPVPVLIYTPPPAPAASRSVPTAPGPLPRA